MRSFGSTKPYVQSSIEVEIIPLAYVKHIMIDLVHNSDKFYKSTHRLYTRRDGRTPGPHSPYTARAVSRVPRATSAMGKSSVSAMARKV